MPFLRNILLGPEYDALDQGFMPQDQTFRSMHPDVNDFAAKYMDPAWYALMDFLEKQIRTGNTNPSAKTQAGRDAWDAMMAARNRGNYNPLQIPGVWPRIVDEKNTYQIPPGWPYNRQSVLLGGRG